MPDQVETHLYENVNFIQKLKQELLGASDRIKVKEKVNEKSAKCEELYDKLTSTQRNSRSIR